MPRRLATAPSTPATAGSRAVRPAAATPPRPAAARAARPTHARAARARRPAVVRERERAERLAQVAEARGVGVRDPRPRRQKRLAPQPFRRLRARADPVPVGRQVVVVGVDEALEQLEPPGRLGSSAGLDGLSDPPLVSLVHVWSPVSF